jgi:hypothetical protein
MMSPCWFTKANKVADAAFLPADHSSLRFRRTFSAASIGMMPQQGIFERRQEIFLAK